MTYGQLGVVDATAFAFGLLMEVPSGAVSDLLGKKKTIATAMVLSCVGALFMSAAHSLMTLWGAFLLMQLGWALYSGSAEALAYDTLIENSLEDRYENVISTSGALATIVTVVTILTGGLLYAWHFRSTHFFWGVAYFLAILASLRLSEPSVDTEHFSLKGYLLQLGQGVKELFKPSLRAYVIVIFSVMGADYLYNYGLMRPVMAVGFGFLDKEQALYIALITLIGAIFIHFIPYFRRFISDKKGLYLVGLLMGLGFMSAFFPLGNWGFFSMLIIGVSGQLAYPWVSIVVNKEIPSKYRATTLSTVALITKVPYVALGVLAGRMAEAGTFAYFSLGTGIVILASIGISAVFLFLRRTKTI